MINLETIIAAARAYIENLGTERETSMLVAAMRMCEVAGAKLDGRVSCEFITLVTQFQNQA